MIEFSKRIKRLVHRVTAPGSSAGNNESKERYRLAQIPRYVETQTNLPGSPFRIPDAASFMASWEEIFDREIYKIKSTTTRPRILDCGANVGVSSLYFRKQFPSARITAFEPDPKIFAYLRDNLAQAGFTDVDLVEKGVWKSQGILRFHSEGADAGRINNNSQAAFIEIHTVRLLDYLHEDVDLLKIDIEGAEDEVLADIAPCLSRVKNIFIEYHSFEGRPQTLGRLIQTLTEAGFRLQIHHLNASPKPFLEVSSHLGMDMQLNIFGYRVDLGS